MPHVEPAGDAALARFNLALGQMVARAGDETDELADALAEEADRHKPSGAHQSPDAASGVEGSRTDAAPPSDDASASSADGGEA